MQIDGRMFSGVAGVYFDYRFRTVVFVTVFCTLMLPPILVVLFMQRWFVKGLVDPEK